MVGRGIAARPLVVALVASLLALATLGLMGAPATALALHGAATVVGLACAAAIARWAWRPSSAMAIAAALAILAVAFMGVELDGTRRWLSLGPVTLQPALFLLPLLLAARRGLVRTLALALAMAALALQPDTGTLAALALALVADLHRDKHRTAILLLLALPLLLWSASAGLGPAPVRFVEGVLTDALAAGILPAILAVLSLALGGVALRRSPMLALFVGGLLIASFLGPFPTPLLGASVSAMLAFWIAVGLAGFHSEPTKA